MLNVWPAGQMWPAQTWYLAHRTPHGLRNLAASEQQQLILPLSPDARVPNPKPCTTGSRLSHALLCGWIRARLCPLPTLPQRQVGTGSCPFSLHRAGLEPGCMHLPPHSQMVPCGDHPGPQIGTASQIWPMERIGRALPILSAGKKG